MILEVVSYGLFEGCSELRSVELPEETKEKYEELLNDPDVKILEIK